MKSCGVLHEGLFREDVCGAHVDEALHTKISNIRGIHFGGLGKISCTRMQIEREEQSKYFEDQKVGELLKRLMKACIIHKPDDPLSFLIECLAKDEIPDRIPEPPAIKGFPVNF